MLHMVCDITIAADNAVFGQTGPKVYIGFSKMDMATLVLEHHPKINLNLRHHSIFLQKLQVGSFDAGYGASIMSRLVGPKRAKEMWFLAKFYSAAEAERMGLVNTVVPVSIFNISSH